jgi:hypothetical protein
MLTDETFENAVRDLANQLNLIAVSIEAAGERIAEAIDYHSGRAVDPNDEPVWKVVVKCWKCSTPVTFESVHDVPEFPTCDGCEHFEQRARDD